MMVISEIIKSENILMEVKGSTKEEILKELISVLKTGEIDEEKLYKDILERESAGSTGLEYGLAIPHVRSENIKHFTIGLALAPNGVDFDSVDGEKTKIFFVIATPKKYNNYHLEALAKIASMMYSQTAVNVLSSCKSKEGLLDLISKLEGKN